MPTSAGYSGTPLAKQLGFKPLSRVFVLDPPQDYPALVEPLPDGIVFDRAATPKTDIAHIFVTRREALAKQLVALRRDLKSDCMLWVSWPKKSSKVRTTITEDTIRALAPG